MLEMPPVNLPDAGFLGIINSVVQKPRHSPVLAEGNGHWGQTIAYTQPVFSCQKDASLRKREGHLPLQVESEDQPQLRDFYRTGFSGNITQHIPDKGAQMIRYYGWWSNKMRGQQHRILLEYHSS